VFLKNHAKSKVFQNNRRPQAFFVKILCQVGDSIFIAAEVSTKPVHSPSGVQRNLRTRRVAPSLGYVSVNVITVQLALGGNMLGKPNFIGKGT